MKYNDLQDYQKRYIKEYVELTDKINKLEKFLEDYVFGNLTYKPSNSYELSAMQYTDMVKYAATLKCRLMYVLGKDYKELIEEYKNIL